MPLVSTQQLVGAARREGVGIGAFNVVTLEHVEAVAAGAESAGRSAIIQISQNAGRFHQGQIRPLALAAAAVARASSAALSLHLDHVDDRALLDQAPGTGITSVMFYASTTDYDANVAATREVVTWARQHEIWVEGELGEIGGKNGAHAPKVRTDPNEAARFVRDTGIAALAVAVGNTHAMREPTAELDLDLIRSLAYRLPVPLVLHGSSGVPDSALAASIGAGMVKINVGTVLNLAFTATVRETLAANPTLGDPRAYLGRARYAMTAIVAHKLEVLDISATTDPRQRRATFPEWPP